MAPEQALGKGDEVGPATDVYALGAILYESLCGRAPFRGETPLDTLDQVRSHDPLPPSRLQPGVPHELETICLKCLAKQPKQRYCTAEQLAKDLRRFLDGEPIEARPVAWWERGRKWSGRHPAATALIVAVAVGLAGITWQWFRAETSRGAAVLAADAAEASRARAIQAASAAVSAREAERAERERVERLLYAHDISLAYHEFLTHKLRRTFQLLDGTPTNLRNWEWRFLNRFCHEEVLALNGHSGAIHDAAFSPDGKLIASISAGSGPDKPGEVKIWDAATGAEQYTLPGHTAWLVRLAFSPDGKRLVTTSSRQEGGVRVWHASDGEFLMTIPLEGHALSVAFSPDGSRLALGRHDGRIVLHDSDTGAQLMAISGHSGSVLDLAFRPDGTLLASAGRDGVASVWDTSDGRKVHSTSGLTDVRTVAFSPDGKRFGIGTWPGYLKIFEVTEHGIHEGPSHPRPTPIWDLKWRPDGQQLVVSTPQEGVQLWDARTFQLLRTFRGVYGRVAFSPNGRRMAGAALDGQLRIWDAAVGPQPFVFLVPSGVCVGEMAMSPDSRQVALTAAARSPYPRSNSDQAVKLLDLSSRVVTKEFKGHKKWVTGVAFSPDGQRLATSSEDKTIKLWDVSTGQEMHTLDGHTAAVAAVAVSRDGSRVVSAGKDKMVKVWDSTTGLEVQTLHGHSAETLCVVYHKDGLKFASADADGMIRIWDATSGRCLAHWRGHEGRINGLEFGRGNLLASCGLDQVIRLWDVAGAIASKTDSLHTLHGHAENVTGICFSSDGERLASVGLDKSVRIWDAATGHELLSIPSTAGNISHVRFSPDGRLLVLSDNYNVKIWHTAEANASAPIVLDAAGAPVSDVAWHRQEANNCERAGQWFGAAFHWDQLANLEPGNWRHLWRRGHACIRQGHWDKAAADLERAIEAGADASVWYNYALLRLREYDEEGYRAICIRMYAAFGDTSDASTANTVAWIGALSAASSADPALLVRLSEQAVAQGGHKWRLNTLGAALYRAGRFEDSLKYLAESVEAHGRGGTPHDWLFLAMAHHASGHAEEAQSWLDKAVVWIDQAIEQQASGARVDPHFTWNHQTELHMLRREAEELLR